ncbi:MAG: hypothetical protein ACQEQG_02960 [Bacillota bacterium]
MDFKKDPGKIVAFSTLLLLTLVILSACGAGISMNIEPNPIEFTEEDVGRDKEITVSMRTTGIGSISVDYLDMSVLDEEGNAIINKKVTVDESSFVVGGLGFEESFNINLCDIIIKEIPEADEDNCEQYYSNLVNSIETNYSLRLVVQGSITSTAEADIIFEEPAQE